jgi:SEC-C motif-containing protein
MSETPLSFRYCLCGSMLAEESCCLPILRDHRRAESALALMRSRYTAFALQHEAHILASWHPTSRPQNLRFEDFPVTWIGLEIHQTEQGEKDDERGTVEFTSTYVDNGHLCRLREKSSFVHEKGLWFYLSGDCQVTRNSPPRNTPCPCGSGKKFKRCCLLSTRPA